MWRVCSFCLRWYLFCGGGHETQNYGTYTYVYDTLFAYRHLVYVLILTGSIVIRSAFCARCLRKEFVNYWICSQLGHLIIININLLLNCVSLEGCSLYTCGNYNVNQGMYMWVMFAILYVKYNWILCNSFIQMILLKQCSFQFINFLDIPVIKWSKTFRVFSICEESTEIRKNKLLIIIFLW